MDMKIQIIKAGEFLKSTPTGELDLQASKDGLAQIARYGAHYHDYTVLIDLREVTTSLSNSDIYELGAHLGRYGETFNRRTAILVRSDGDLDKVIVFEDVAQNRGFWVRAFVSFEEAILWLGKAEDVEKLNSPKLDSHRKPGTSV
jgi:hypothetical protein